MLQYLYSIIPVYFCKSVISFLKLKCLKFHLEISFFEFCVIVQLGMIKNCAWWSYVRKIRLTAIQSSFITMLKMQYIKVWLRLVYLIEEVLLGRQLVQYMMSRKSETFLFNSDFTRSILKLSSNITSLFSMTDFSKRLQIFVIQLTVLHAQTFTHASYNDVLGVFLDYLHKN